MIELTLWLLLAVSDGIGNRGTTTVIDQFGSAEKCQATIDAIRSGGGWVNNTTYRCVQATVLRPAGVKQ